MPPLDLQFFGFQFAPRWMNELIYSSISHLEVKYIGNQLPSAFHSWHNVFYITWSCFHNSQPDLEHFLCFQIDYMQNQLETKKCEVSTHHFLEIVETLHWVNKLFELEKYRRTINGDLERGDFTEIPLV